MLSISRTCGGDPKKVISILGSAVYFPHMRGWSQYQETKEDANKVFPAHAGVILSCEPVNNGIMCISRTCGGDPTKKREAVASSVVFPAHAGVILKKLLVF